MSRYCAACASKARNRWFATTDLDEGPIIKQALERMEEYAGGLDALRRQVNSGNVRWDVVDMTLSAWTGK